MGAGRNSHVGRVSLLTIANILMMLLTVLVSEVSVVKVGISRRGGELY